MSNINYIACQLLNCWYLDIQLLDELLEAYDLDLDIEEVSINYWKIDNVNILIYEAYNEIKNMCLEENEEQIKSLWYSVEDFEEWRDYEIFTNYIDSHLRFNDEKMEAIYENWRKR